MVEECLNSMSIQDAMHFEMEQENHHAVIRTGIWPLLELDALLKKLRSNIKTEDDIPVVKGYFDHYLYNLKAPGHRLTVIGRYLIENHFLQFKSKDEEKGTIYMWLALPRTVDEIGSH